MQHVCGAIPSTDAGAVCVCPQEWLTVSVSAMRRQLGLTDSHMLADAQPGGRAVRARAQAGGGKHRRGGGTGGGGREGVSRVQFGHMVVEAGGMSSAQVCSELEVRMLLLASAMGAVQLLLR